MSCADVQTIQAGDGTKSNFSFDFPYLFKSEIKVYFWNRVTKEYDEIAQDGTGWGQAPDNTIYPWEVSDANPTIVHFTEVDSGGDTAEVPPAPAAAVDPNEEAVDNVKIRRVTNVDDIRALFNPGSAIRSDDLNKNFEQLRYAIQEGTCQGISDDVYQYLLDNYWDRFDNTLYDGNTWVSDDTKIATSEAIDDRVDSKIDDAIEDDILINDTGLTKSATGGQVTLGIGEGEVGLDRIKPGDIITQAEQDASSPAPGDTNIFTASAAARRFDTLVQTDTPTGSAWETGKTWYQNDEDKTVFVWDGSEWDAITSGGAFTRLDQVIYVDATNGNDDNNGHRISTPKKTIKSALAAINSDATYGDGSTILVAPGVYQEEAPLDIEKKDVAIIGASVRNVIVHPTEATETNSLFRVNSGSYLQNMTFTGVKASGTRGDTGSLWEDATYGLPPTQGWNVSFYPDAMIYKSPYIQNCTNFSDSEIDNDDLAFYTGDSDKGRAGDLDSAPTGGGLLINGATVHEDSPLRSIVADSYTHVGLDGPGIFVTNNGYCQVTSSYAFFNHFHIACINGGQANLAASTTDFGRYSLVADGRSTSAIFTATTSAEATDGSNTFTIGTPTAGDDWHGSATRPQDNMLVDIGGNTYPVLSATANGTGWDVTILRPNANDRTENLGLDGTVASGSAVSFFLRSMVASSGHTMEYVGSGTNYSALPGNGGVPNDDNQVIELNNGVAVNNTSTFGGKVWAAITDHNGTFKVGDTFEVNQQTGFVSIPGGALSVNTLLETLDTNNNPIQNDSGTSVDINDDLQIQGGNTLLFADDDNSNTLGFTAPSSVTANVTFTLPDGDGNSGEVLSTDGSGTLSWSSSSAVVDRIIEGNTSIIAEDTGTDGSLTFTTEGSTAMTIDSNQDVTINQDLTVSTNATVTGDLTVDTDTLFVDSTNDRVAVGTTSPAEAFEVQSASNTTIRIDNEDDSTAKLHFHNTGSTDMDISVSDASMTFNHGASERVRIDSDGRLLVGASSAPNANASAILQLADSLGPRFILARNDTETIAGEHIGSIRFYNNDDDGNYDECARIAAEAESDYTSTSKPTYIRFLTTASGDSSPTERVRIDSSGRLLIGGSSNLSISTDNPALQIQGVGADTSSAALYRYQNNTNGPYFYLAKSRGTTVGTAGAVSDNDILGQIRFNGDDGTDLDNIAAIIESRVDGTPATGSMPGELKFRTNDGTVDANPTTRMIIRANGNVGVGTESPLDTLHIVGGLRVDAGSNGKIDFGDVTSNYGRLYADSTGTFVGSVTSDPLIFRTGNSERARIDSDGRLLVGTSSNIGSGADNRDTLNLVSAAGGGLLLGRNDTTVTDGNNIGRLEFWGNDSDGTYQECAEIVVEADGAHATDDKPTRIKFLLTASGASSPTEKFRINSNGAWGIEGANYGTEGQVLQSRGNDAPQWASPSIAVDLQQTNAGTEDEYFFTNIPTWANVIIINFHDVSLNVSNDIRVQLGSDGTYYDSNYRSTSTNGPQTAGAYRTDSFVIDTVGTSNVMNGHMVLTCMRRRTDSLVGRWVENHNVMNSNTGYGLKHGGGRFNNATANGDINCIRIYAQTNTTEFDSGQISLTYF